MEPQPHPVWRSFPLFIVFAVISGCLAFLGGRYPGHYLHVYATCTVALYGVVLLWMMRRGNGHGAEQHPESVYIVGYIVTIAGLAGIAVQIGSDPAAFGDYQKMLPIVLKGGGAAVLSTLVGLIFMNILKMMNDNHTHEEEREDRHISEMSKRFAEEFARSLGSQKSTAGFKDNLERMSSQLMSGALGVERLAHAAVQAEENIGRISVQMNAFVTSMGRLQDTAVSVAEIWKDLPTHAAATTQLKEAMAGSATAMSAMGTSSEMAATSLGHLVSVFPPLTAAFKDTLTTVNKQLVKVGDSNDVLIRLLDWATNANLVINELHGSFSDIRQIKDNLQQVASNLSDANSELLTFNNEAIKLGNSGTQFATGVADMSKSIWYAVTDLSRISEHIAIIGKMADVMNDNVDDTTLLQFKHHITDFVTTTNSLNKTLDESKKTLTEADEAVRKFRDVTLELAKAIPQMGSR